MAYWSRIERTRGRIHAGGASQTRNGNDIHSNHRHSRWCPVHGPPMRDCLKNLPVTTVSFTSSGNINLQLDSSLPISQFLRPDLSTFSPCAICLDIYELNDPVRLLPCHHFFHKSCIDTWLNQADNCPTCRGDVRSLYRDLVNMAAVQRPSNRQQEEAGIPIEAQETRTALSRCQSVQSMSQQHVDSGQENLSPQDSIYVFELSNLSLSDSERMQGSSRRRAAATATATTARDRGYPTDPVRRHAVQAAERRRFNPVYHL
ncbi:E3 ubiquitin protein ligase RNF128 [Echinococcus multilocularis]|uniref:E3 ubiquitin protein ligase RNF128 n=1 Tax=Echinococcus multilocularis TaxID=6211 RepID=A0A068YDP3_ECHMU|nr:E3 ubiquitin protein ligase RNF128 [Echinococcus multilocularis]